MLAYKTREGKAEIEVFDGVFYNPRAVLSRSVGVLFVRTASSFLSRNLSVADALAATGVRGIRYTLESGAVSELLLNDIDSRAAANCERNLHNNSLERIGKVSNEDANVFLLADARGVDFADIDPFGSPTEYLDSAVAAVRLRGFLAATATDMQVLCGLHPDVSLRKYGGLSLRSEFCHEVAVRLLVGAIAAAAARHDRGIDVLLTHSTEHYVRAYVRVRRSRRKDLSENVGLIVYCPRCLFRAAVPAGELAQPNCPSCEGPLTVAGPLWVGPIADKRFLELALDCASEVELQEWGRITKMLVLIKGECALPPGYYTTDSLAKLLRCSTVSPRALVAELSSAGFRTSLTHFNAQGFKTDAPHTLVLETYKKLAAKA